MLLKERTAARWKLLLNWSGWYRISLVPDQSIIAILSYDAFLHIFIWNITQYSSTLVFSSGNSFNKTNQTPHRLQFYWTVFLSGTSRSLWGGEYTVSNKSVVATGNTAEFRLIYLTEFPQLYKSPRKSLVVNFSALPQWDIFSFRPLTSQYWLHCF